MLAFGTRARFRDTSMNRTTPAPQAVGRTPAAYLPSQRTQFSMAMCTRTSRVNREVPHLPCEVWRRVFVQVEDACTLHARVRPVCKHWNANVNQLVSEWLDVLDRAAVTPGTRCQPPPSVLLATLVNTGEMGRITSATCLVTHVAAESAHPYTSSMPCYSPERSGYTPTSPSYSPTFPSYWPTIPAFSL